MSDSPEPAAEAVAAVTVDLFPVELVILDHYARQSRCRLASLPAVFGRDEKDDVRLSDPWISHSHCEIFQQGSILNGRHRDSKNGVFMHGVRVRESEILPGDCLVLGRTEITIRYRRPQDAGNEQSADSTASMPTAPAVPRRPNAGPMTEELLY